MNNNPHVAIVGASGAVGVEMIRTLERRNFPVGSLRLLASKRSAGKSLNFREETLTIEELTLSSFEGVDIALFSAGGGISKEWGPQAVKAGAVVVDNSSAFRLDASVPLVVQKSCSGCSIPGHRCQSQLHDSDYLDGPLSVASGLWC